MPIYEYSCPVCGRIEVIQKASDKALKNCPECAEKGKKSAVEKLVSTSSFHLKGSGWYKTDYSSGAASSSPGKSKGTAKPESAEGSSSTKDSGTEKSSAPKACGGGGCGCH